VALALGTGNPLFLGESGESIDKPIGVTRDFVQALRALYARRVAPTVLESNAPNVWINRYPRPPLTRVTASMVDRAHGLLALVGLKTSRPCIISFLTMTTSWLR
jgi:hypothetical protein